MPDWIELVRLAGARAPASGGASLVPNDLLKAEVINSTPSAVSNQEDGSVVITIDGPAGAGKSTVARRLAKRLDFEFLDTGAMYRCVTLAVLRAGISVTNVEAVKRLASSLQIILDGETVLLNGDDVSHEIRTPKVASAIGLIADNIEVREILSNLQRRWTQGKKVVTEGRDQGSEVFPNSPCKIFLIADPTTRAERRQIELASRGIEMTLAAVLEQQQKRDEEDESRPVGRLCRADDALEVSTDGLSLEAVVDKLVEVVQSRIPNLNLATRLDQARKDRA